jgi:hypothetical protein
MLENLATYVLDLVYLEYVYSLIVFVYRLAEDRSNK